MDESMLIDFLENALECGVGEIQEIIRVRPDELLQRRMEMLGLLEDTWVGVPLSDQRQAEKIGEIWPVLPRNAPDVISLARTRATSDARFGTSNRAADASKRDIQSLLLYAHGVHLPNPLRLAGRVEDDTREFLRAISQICTLAPLISNGVVRVFEPSPAPKLNLKAAQAKALDDLGAHIGLALMSYEGNRQMHQGLLRMAADVLLDRAIEHLTDLAVRKEQDHGSLLLPTPYDGAAMNALLGVLAKEGETPSGGMDKDSHQIRLSQLAQLELPGLENLDAQDMVSIREDESFGVFRTDMTAALLDADQDVSEGRLDIARRIVGEHMDAGIARLNAGTRRGVLGDAMIGATVEWGLGSALAASLAGLRGLVASLLSQTVASATRKWPTDGERALRAHYVELGTASLKMRHADPIDFMAFDTDQLWGPSLGLPGREARGREIVQSLLEDLPPGTQE
jgi:hypothetical protein